MGLVELLDSLLKIGVGVFIGAALYFYRSTRADNDEIDLKDVKVEIAEKSQADVAPAQWRQDKLDRSLELLVEYNQTLGDVKHALSNYIDHGGEEFKAALKKADQVGLDAFNKFYAIEAYLLSAGAVEAHNIMDEYIILVSKIRREFHHSRARESNVSLDTSVADIKACRRRLYTSINEFYSNTG